MKNIRLSTCWKIVCAVILLGSVAVALKFSPAAQRRAAPAAMKPSSHPAPLAEPSSEPSIAVAEPPSPPVKNESPAPQSPAPPVAARSAAPQPQPAARSQAQATRPAQRGGRRQPEPIRDPVAREALSFVGVDPNAEQYWVAAINDPDLPAEERKDLIEDLNEDGFVDPHHPTIDDFPLIVSRLQLIEDIGADAMDQTNAEAFQEAYKDLVNLLAGGSAQ